MLMLGKCLFEWYNYPTHRPVSFLWEGGENCLGAFPTRLPSKQGSNLSVIYLAQDWVGTTTLGHWAGNDNKRSYCLHHSRSIYLDNPGLDFQGFLFFSYNKKHLKNGYLHHRYTKQELNENGSLLKKVSRI